MFGRLLLILPLALAALWCSATRLEAQVLFSEGFDDGVADGFTVVLGAWEVVGGTYHARTTGSEIAAVSVVTVPGAREWTDYHFECEFLAYGSVDQMVRFRESTPDDCYEVNVRAYPFSDVYLQKNVGGVQTFLSVVPLLNYTDVWHHISVDVAGPRIVVRFDGVQLFDFVDSDSPLLQGTVGLKSWSGAYGWQDVYFDNVLVLSPPVAARQPSWGGMKLRYR